MASITLLQSYCRASTGAFLPPISARLSALRLTVDKHKNITNTTLKILVILFRFMESEHPPLEYVHTQFQHGSSFATYKERQYQRLALLRSPTADRSKYPRLLTPEYPLICFFQQPKFRLYTLRPASQRHGMSSRPVILSLAKLLILGQTGKYFTPTLAFNRHFLT